MRRAAPFARGILATGYFQGWYPDLASRHLKEFCATPSTPQACLVDARNNTTLRIFRGVLAEYDNNQHPVAQVWLPSYALPSYSEWLDTSLKISQGGQLVMCVRRQKRQDSLPWFPRAQNKKKMENILVEENRFLLGVTYNRHTGCLTWARFPSRTKIQNTNDFNYFEMKKE